MVLRSQNCCWGGDNKDGAKTNSISIMISVFIGRTDAETEAPIYWPSNLKSWLIVKDSDGGKDWRQKENEMAEDEIVR